MFIYKIFHFVLFIFSFSFHSNATNENEILARFQLRDKQEVVIRLIRDEDINESADIIREAYLDDCLRIKHATPEQYAQMHTVPVERTRSALRDFKNEKDSVLLVAERVGGTTEAVASAAEGGSNGSRRLAGCIRVKLNPKGNTKDDGPFAQIGPFATLLSLHGSGIGIGLINAVEQYAVARWKVCEIHLDAHGIPEPVAGVAPSGPLPKLLQFYEKRKYRRIGKTTWFDPATANYVQIPGSLCHLERMVKDICVPAETGRSVSVKRGREAQKGAAAEDAQSGGKRKRKHQHNRTESIRNYALDLVKNGDELNSLVEAAVDLAHEVGLIKRLADDNSRERSDLASIQPITLFPSPFPRSVYQQAVDVHAGLQKLYFRISCDYEFLVDATQEMAKTNELVRRMVEIMQQVEKEGQRQPYTLLLTRSDYLVDSARDEKDGQQQKFGLKQIGMNIGDNAQSAAMGPRTAEMHRRMLQRVRMDASNVPENRAFNTLARGLFQGWLRFGDSDAVVVFAVAKGSARRFDERAIEYELQRISDGQVQIVRVSTTEAYSKLHLDNNDFTLRLSDGRTVALVYSRSGPLSEWTDEEWEARRTIERSTAIKTSTMFSALSSSKRVQQLLVQPGTIERFMPDAKDREMVEAIRRTFVGMWGLEKDDEHTQQLVQHAIDNPGLYVLKAQNEGDGQNYFGEQLRDKLQKFTHEERAVHALMQRIQPMTTKNYLVHPTEEPVLDDVVVELGMFGYLLGDKRDQSVVRDHNRQQGYVVSTKPASSTAGTIAAGGVYDSLNLF